MKTTKPLVSVVIPVYNGVAYLEEAVKSVQDSTYSNFEILLLNDGSKDLSAKLCLKLASKYPNIRFFDFSSNRGLAHILNSALKIAKGKYICRLNQDDLMTKNRIELQVNFLEANPDYLAVGSQLDRFNKAGRVDSITYLQTDCEIKKNWYIISPFADPAVMYLKRAATSVGGYDQKYWPAEDIHMWYRLGDMGKLANLPQTLTKFRLHDKAASLTHFRTQIKNTYLVHNWAHQNIKPASIMIRGYWLIQLVCGLTLGPGINWLFYILVKKLVSGVYNAKNLKLKLWSTKPLNRPGLSA